MAGYSPDLEARLAVLQLELDVRKLYAAIKVALLTGPLQDGDITEKGYDGRIAASVTASSNITPATRKRERSSLANSRYHLRHLLFRPCRVFGCTQSTNKRYRPERDTE